MPPAAHHSASHGRLVLIALALAVAAVVMTNLYIAYHSDVRERSFDVYVLTRSVKAGDSFKKEDWRTVSFPEKFEPHFDALGAMNQRDLASWVDKERFRRPARRGAPLTYDLFTSLSEAPLDVTVQKGMVHMDLPVNGRLVPAGVRPGVQVDIEAHLDSGKGIPEVMLVMESVKVVGVDRATMQAEHTARSARRNRSLIRKITIEVEPHLATTLSMIEKIAIGDFELRLRNPDDATRRLKGVPPGQINPQLVDLLNELRARASR